MFSQYGEACREPAQGRPGSQRIYARTAIETALTGRIVLGLALRQVEGLLRSLCEQLELAIPIPDHTTLSRRARKLGKVSPAAVCGSGPLHLLVDSTGLSVHTGNQRKPPDQRPWRKLHIAVDASTGNVTAVELTANATHDSRLVPRLLKQLGSAEALAQHAKQRGQSMSRVLIPTRKGACLDARASAARKQRSRTIRSIDKHGRRQGHKTSGYSRRSLVENVNYRYEAILGCSITGAVACRAAARSQARVPHPQGDGSTRDARQRDRGVYAAITLHDRVVQQRRLNGNMNDNSVSAADDDLRVR